MSDIGSSKPLDECVNSTSKPTESEQYKTDEHLRTRAEIHARFTIGPSIEDALDKFLALKVHDALLDVGTGTGDFPARMRQSGHRGRLVGLDLSAGMLRAAAQTHGQDIEWIEGDACTLPFPDASFDVVTARHMLYHVSSIERALSEAHRVLRNNGQFVATTNARNSMHEFWETLEAAVAEITEFAALLNLFSSKPFDHEHLTALSTAVFGRVELELVPAILEFPDIHSALRYFDSFRTMQPISTHAWEAGRESFIRHLEEKFENPAWRVTKGVVLIKAIKS